MRSGAFRSVDVILMRPRLCGLTRATRTEKPSFGLTSRLARNVRQLCDGRGRRFGMPRHGALGHIDAELEELGMDARGAPEWIRRDDSTDEPARAPVRFLRKHAGAPSRTFTVARPTDRSNPL
jgi:hypothetical protein